MTANRIAFDTNVSAQVQGDIQALAVQLESLIGQRQADVSQAMADFRADGVDSEYQEPAGTRQRMKPRPSLRWSGAPLASSTAISSARDAVQGIG